MTHEERRSLQDALYLSRLPGAGAATCKKLLLAHTNPQEARAAHEALQLFPEREKAETREAIQRTMQWVEAGGNGTWLGGPHYPRRLLDLGEPPPVLFWRGQTAALSQPMIAIVGARDIDPESHLAAGKIATACVAAGFGVVSGGARGIDTAAHEACLAAGGSSVAIFGCGVDVTYPPEHEVLFQKLCNIGAVTSELMVGTAPHKSFFLTRNRIIAALSVGVIVVRARAKSGANTTATWARKLGRPLAACKSQGPLGQLAEILVEKGANAIDTEDALQLWLAQCRESASRNGA